MIHRMKLWNDSFVAIKSGSKTIEMRLNDEKRKLIKPKDYIEFTNTSTNEKILCVVIDIYRYYNFEELYENHNKTSLGYKADEAADPSDMLDYYSDDDIKKYGVVGIELKLLKGELFIKF